MPKGHRPEGVGVHIRQITRARDTIARALVQADSLLWVTNHLSQHKINYWISYKDSSVEFDRGLKCARNVC